MRLPFINPPHAHVSAALLSAYLDNQTTAVERARVDAHLATCAVCRGELESLRQMVAVVRALPRVAVPRAFTLSEARLGIRRPTAQPRWLGGALRGLAAATALVLVVVVGGALWRQFGSQPAEQLAFAPAPTAAPAARSSESGPAAAPQPEMAVPPQPTVVATVVVEKVMEKPAEKLVPTAAPKPVEPTLAPRPTAAAVAPTATSAPAAKAAAPAAPTATPAPTATIGVMAAASAPSAATTATAPAIAREMLTTDAGRGGGGVDQPTITPEALPAMAPITVTLPAGAGAAYADLQGLWALDRKTGSRQIVRGDGIVDPIISSDRAWIAYRVLRGDRSELWIVRWDGKDARLLWAERDLPKDDLGAGYSERRFGEAHWLPGRLALALNVTVVPTGGDMLPRFELWLVDAQSGGRRLAVKLEAPGRPVFSADGQRFALLQPGAEKSREGSLTIYGTDAADGRVALKFTRGAAPRFYETQVSWLPDGKTLLAAIADPVDSSEQRNGLTLYRVPADGQAQSIGRVDAFDSFWSADGTRLAYTRAVNTPADTRELWIANTDGANPQRYATLRNGGFVNWSPDSVQFIYSDAESVYLGGVGQPPRRLGNIASVFDPHWIGPGQIIHLHDQNTGWMLVSRTVDGAAASLLLLPREATYDVTRP